MTLNEKVAYIKGLSDGLELDTTKPEGKLIKALQRAPSPSAWSTPTPNSRSSPRASF